MFRIFWQYIKIRLQIKLLAFKKALMFNRIFNKFKLLYYIT